MSTGAYGEWSPEDETRARRMANRISDPLDRRRPEVIVVELLREAIETERRGPKKPVDDLETTERKAVLAMLSALETRLDDCQGRILGMRRRVEAGPKGKR